ncbi:hypothetical protein [Parendozoicomonas haliclonae]|uniref:Uncharacterized protein n=1 Tax=Parendozoicomonas haliclonae TaxID=1960125 RepID=A0A1X7AIK8_9GAMM|nr:hypothetical protein [Parendozoicomonas haliclonae]SMA43511.1 hypothetical protein EHSB41UT_01611 [Parendozoicomonas haliclonae]
MKKITIICLFSLIGCNSAQAALEILADDDLSAVNGRAGITLEIQQEALQNSNSSLNKQKQAVTIDELVWQSAGDGSKATFKNIGIGQAEGGPSTLTSKVRMDVSALEGLILDIEQSKRRLTVDGIYLGDNFDRSFGGLITDYQLDGTVKISAGSPGIKLRGKLGIKDSSIRYLDAYTSEEGERRSHDLLLQGITFSASTTDAPDSFANWRVAEDANGDFVSLDLNKINTSLTIQDIYNDPYDADLGEDRFSESYGALEARLEFDGSLVVRSGGVSPDSGINFNPTLATNCAGGLKGDCLTAASKDDNKNQIFWWDGGIDTGQKLGLANYFGKLTVPEGITLDLMKGAPGTQDYILVAYENLNLRFGVEDIFIGSSSKSLGEVFGQFTFNDTNTITGETNTSSIPYNSLKLYAGGAEGDSGITADLSWNMSDGNLRYADDVQDKGAYVWFAGLASYGTGTAAIDVVRRDSAYDINASPTSNLTSGIRLALTDLSGAWRLRGISVQTDADALPDYANLQGGTEFLYLLRLYQAFEFEDWDMNVFLDGGGFQGEGITMNVDSVITNSRGGLFLNYDPEEGSRCFNGCGIWSDGMDIQSSIRNATLDIEGGVTDFVFMDSDGTIERPEREALYFRSNVFGHKSISGIHLGSADSLTDANSFGQLALTEHQNMNVAISTGGDPERGDQGVTIFLSNELLPAGGSYIDYRGTLNNEGDDASLAKVNTLKWTPDKDNEEGYLELFGVSTPDGALTNTLNLDVAENSAGDQGFAINLLTEFNELRIDSINIGSQPLVNEAVIYNMRIQSNIVATPF